VLNRAASLRRVGPYQLQAAVAAVHAEGETDWPAVAALYGQLARISPSPIVELNRAVAVAMVEGADRGLDLIDRIEGRPPGPGRPPGTAGPGARCGPSRRPPLSLAPSCSSTASSFFGRRRRRFEATLIGAPSNFRRRLPASRPSGAGPGL
jgi:hypothetical protein